MAGNSWSDVATAASDILSRQGPVLLLDACALLDVRRAPVRKKMEEVAVVGAQRLQARATSASGAPWLVAASLVVTEYQRHAQTATEELERVLMQATAHLAAATHSAKYVLATPSPPVVDFRALGLHTALEALAETLLSRLHILAADDDDCHVRAYRRTVRSDAPASPGKPESADCVITEHYLALAGALRRGGLKHPIVFVSSNTADYGSPKQIRSPLDREFAALDIRFTTDFAWADSLL